MALGINLSFHRRFLLILLAFTWTIILCVVGFQYFREKEVKSELLCAQLQLYNSHLIERIEDGESIPAYINGHRLPFEELRVSIIKCDGRVVYDNALPTDSLDNHSTRPEVAEALRSGRGYHIGRQSASDGREYFYAAMRGGGVVVRTAIPYSASLHELLAADLSFLVVLISISFAMSIFAFFTTRRLSKDIERVNHYEAEQEKTRIKRQLTNNINHELKTPVASMQVCLETLLSGIQLSEEKRMELIERCYVNNDRLKRLLADVSLITRMEDGGGQIAREPVMLNQIVDEIAAELSIMPKETPWTLHSNVCEPVVVNANLSLMVSIFRNLTENAIAYSGGSNIYITLLENDEKHCVIRFEDDGRGVAPEQLPRLFERFYRVDKGRSRQTGGTGLGLAIVKHAVQHQGGTVSVSNRSEGGLKFEFSLMKG